MKSDTIKTIVPEAANIKKMTKRLSNIPISNLAPTANDPDCILRGADDPSIYVPVRNLRKVVQEITVTLKIEIVSDEKGFRPALHTKGNPQRTYSRLSRDFETIHIFAEGQKA